MSDQDQRLLSCFCSSVTYSSCDDNITHQTAGRTGDGCLTGDRTSCSKQASMCTCVVHDKCCTTIRGRVDRRRIFKRATLETPVGPVPHSDDACRRPGTHLTSNKHQNTPPLGSHGQPQPGSDIRDNIQTSFCAWAAWAARASSAGVARCDLRLSDLRRAASC